MTVDVGMYLGLRSLFLAEHFIQSLTLPAAVTGILRAFAILLDGSRSAAVVAFGSIVLLYLGRLLSGDSGGVFDMRPQSLDICQRSGVL